MIEQFIAAILHPLTLTALGLLAHFLKAFAEIAKNTGTVITPLQYYVRNPYHSALSLIGAVLGYALLIGTVDTAKLPDEAADAIRINAFFIGYMADSMIDMLGQRSSINKQPPSEVKP